MRVLILSAAILAYVSGAPSGAILTPLSPLPAIAIPSSIPTIPRGDIEAAAINAKVAVDDATQQAIDQSRLSHELANQNINEKQIEVTDLSKEQSLEAFWATEDNKWQAIDAAKTYEARLNGDIASNADKLANAAIAAPYVATPIIAAPYAAAVPAITAPYLAAFYGPQSQSISTQSLSQTHPIPEVKPIIAEPIVKAVPAVPIKEEPIKKAEDLIFPLKSGLKGDKLEFAYLEKPLYATGPITFPLGVPLAGLRYGEPWILPQVALIQPELKSIATSSTSQTHGQGFLFNTLVKN